MTDEPNKFHGAAFRNAVELDEYLAGLTDEERAKARPNTGYVAQAQSAMADNIAERERILGHKARWVPHTGTPEWVRLGMLDTIFKWHQGEALTCTHMPSMDRPEPVHSAAWKPGLVVCDQCKELLNVTGVADKTCDGCGHECQGLPDDGIMPVSVFATFLCYHIGVCVNCHQELLRAEREATE